MVEKQNNICTNKPYTHDFELNSILCKEKLRAISILFPRLFHYSRAGKSKTGLIVSHYQIDNALCISQAFYLNRETVRADYGIDD